MHNLTLNEFNTALNVINEKTNEDAGYREPETCTEQTSNKLFNIYRDDFWFATAYDNNYLYYYSTASNGISNSSECNYGLKPVVSLKPVTLEWKGSYWEVDWY